MRAHGGAAQPRVVFRVPWKSAPAPLALLLAALVLAVPLSFAAPDGAGDSTAAAPDAASHAATNGSERPSGSAQRIDAATPPPTVRPASSPGGAPAPPGAPGDGGAGPGSGTMTGSGGVVPGTGGAIPGPAPASASVAIAGDAETRFRKAGEAYETGRYAEAAALYQSILKDGYDDARVQYNLGNAWFKQGRLGLANLCYERALVHDPSDADAKENLAYASLLITDKVGAIEEEFPAKLIASVERSFGPDRALPLLAILALAASAAALPLWFRPSPRTRSLCRAALGLLLPLAGIVLVLAWIGSARPGHAEYAIVLGDSADGRSAPAADGTVLFTVHEGLKVEVRGERGEWMHIGLPNGLTGWIEANRAEKI